MGENIIYFGSQLRNCAIPSRRIGALRWRGQNTTQVFRLHTMFRGHRNEWKDIRRVLRNTIHFLGLMNWEGEGVCMVTDTHAEGWCYMPQLAQLPPRWWTIAWAVTGRTSGSLFIGYLYLQFTIKNVPTDVGGHTSLGSNEMSTKAQATEGRLVERDE